ncbi:MAG: hypothetical protein IPM99_07415 [Rubrivivax sp.]|nr:hypothetical protein [Rubrivivax sp.]
MKQRVLGDNLLHLAKVRPSGCGGRSKARPGVTAGARALSVRHVVKKGVVLVGFHGRKSRLRGRLSLCPVLPPAAPAPCWWCCAS